MKVDVKKILKKFLLISWALFPILGQYELKIAPISLGEIVTLLSTMLLCVYNKKVKINKSIFIVGLLISAYNFIPGLNYNSITNTINNSLSIMLFFIIIALSFPEIKDDLKDYYGILKVSGLICTIFLFIQFIMHNFFEINIYGRLFFLDNWFKCSNESVFIWINIGRPDSLFYEPAHYCVYMSAILLLALFFKNYIYAAIFGLGMVLSTSTTGYAMILICVSMYMLTIMNKRKKILLVPIIIIVVFYMMAYGELNIGKLSKDNLDNNIRVFGTLKYFEQFSFSDWITGIGFNRLSEWGATKGIINNNYSNSILFMIFSFGIFGVGFTIYFITKLIKDKYWFPMVLVMLAILCSDQICFNRNFGYLLICVLLCSSTSISEVKRKKDEEIYERKKINNYNSSI